MKIWFKNANILDSGKVSLGEVVVYDEKIVYVGESALNNFVDFKNLNEKQIEEKVDRIIDVNGNILMSGFVNAHAHTPSTVLRGVADDLPLHDWLEKIIPLEKMLTEEDIFYSTLLGLAEYAMAGITCVEENYANIKPILRAYEHAGVRARITIGFPNVDMRAPEMPLEDELALVKNAGFDTAVFAHSIYGTSAENFDKINLFAKENNLAVTTHMSETLKEVGDATAKLELTPVEYLEYLGFFDRNATVYHCVHADKDDLQILADYNVNVVTCPSSNLKLASGVAPIYAMHNKGLNIAIGTDGAYSNNSYDMFKEMFLVATLNKATLYDAEIVKATEVLEMATVNGAKALGMENKIGRIKEGFLADLILVDINKPHNMPHNNLVSNLVYSTKSSDVYLTMVGGKIIYENGKLFFKIPLEEIYKKINKIKEKIKLIFKN